MISNKSAGVLTSLKAILDSVITRVIERTDLDAHRTAMIFAEIGETARVDHARDLSIFVVDGLGQNGLYRALTNADLALGTEICHPGVLILRAKGQVFDAGQDRCQAHARPVFWRDNQAAHG